MIEKNWHTTRDLSRVLGMVGHFQRWRMVFGLRMKMIWKLRKLNWKKTLDDLNVDDDALGLVWDGGQHESETGSVIDVLDVVHIFDCIHMVWQDGLMRLGVFDMDGGVGHDDLWLVVWVLVMTAVENVKEPDWKMMMTQTLMQEVWHFSECMHQPNATE